MIAEPKMENGIFEDTYLTSFSQTGIHGYLTNKSLLSILENIAGEHSAYVHYSFNEIKNLNLTWMLLSWKIRTIKKVKPDDLIKIQTWGRGFSKLFVYRDFKIFDSTGDLCVIATSKWCLVDITTNKIAKMPENIVEIYHGFNDESVFNIDDLPKIAEPKDEFACFDTYRIRRFDLDLNKHVHNLNYLNIAYEILPEDVYYGSEFENLEILYKRELKYGDTVKSYLYKVENTYTVVLKSEDESITHAIIKLY